MDRIRKGKNYHARKAVETNLNIIIIKKEKSPNMIIKKQVNGHSFFRPNSHPIKGPPFFPISGSN